jgi:ABC-2 type transport system permease protein
VKHVTTVAGRELKSLFVSPVAYGILSLFSVLAGLFFVLGVAGFVQEVMYYERMQNYMALQQLNLNDRLIADLYGTMSIVLLFLVPAITMGLFAGEKTNGTQELLFTSPLTMWDIVLGKFAAGAAFVALLVLIVGAFPGLLFVYGEPELGKTMSGLLGLLLVGWTYVAVGTFASSLTRSQVVSFLIAVVLLLLLLLLAVISSFGIAGGVAGDLLRWLGTPVHFEELRAGLVDTADLIYFAFMIGAFLVLTKVAVESVRWR